MLGMLALRDAAVVAAALAAWHWIAPLSAGSGLGADLAGVVAGFLVGAATFVGHEWGHLLAGLAAGGRFPAATSLKSAYLFNIDPANTMRQFAVMSLGGFAVTGVALLVVTTRLPDQYLATHVARGIVGFLATLTVVLEFPLLAFTLATGRIPEVASVAGAPDAEAR